MECLIGITGRDFVLMATDCVANMSILAMKKGVRVLYSILLVMLAAMAPNEETQDQGH